MHGGGKNLGGPIRPDRTDAGRTLSLAGGDSPVTPPAGDVEHTTALDADFTADLPQSLRRCINGGEYAALRLRSSIVAKQQATDLAAAHDPLITSLDAPEVAERVMREGGYTNLSETYQEFLEKVIGFGLENGLTEGEIISVAYRLSGIANDEEGFVSSFMTIVELKIGKIFDETSKASGGKGISSDYHEVASIVEEAIFEGRISVEVKSALEERSNPSVFASYDLVKDTINYPNAVELIDPLRMFEAVIHECRHAYQDIKSIPLSPADSEGPAHLDGIRAKTLLREAYSFHGDSDDLLQGEVNSIADASQQLLKGQLQCMGYTDCEIEELLLQRKKTDENLAEWRERALERFDEVGRSSLLADFPQVYAPMNLRFTFESGAFDRQVLIARQLDAGERASLKRATATAHRSLSILRKRFQESVTETYRATVAWSYAAWLQYSATYFYFMDKPAWHALFAEIDDVEEALAEALMDHQIPFDGAHQMKRAFEKPCRILKKHITK